MASGSDAASFFMALSQVQSGQGDGGCGMVGLTTAGDGDGDGTDRDSAGRYGERR